MLAACIRFSVRLANSANDTATPPQKTVKHFDDGNKYDDDVDLPVGTMSLMEKFPVTFGEPCKDWGDAWDATREIVEGMTPAAVTGDGTVGEDHPMPDAASGEEENMDLDS